MGLAEVLAQQGLHKAHGHQKKMGRHEPFFLFLVKLGRKTKKVSKRTPSRVTMPYTGEALRLSEGGLLAVQQELAARRVPNKTAGMAESEVPPEQPVVPPTKKSGTPKVTWDGVRKDPHGRRQGLLNQSKGMLSGKLGERKATTSHGKLKPDAETRVLGSGQVWAALPPIQR